MKDYTSIKGLINKKALQKSIDVNQDGYGGACVNVAINVMKHLDDFKDEFNIDYRISNDVDVSIEIYDNSGRKVNSIRKLNQKAGYYTEKINSYDIGTQLGMFHIRITAGTESISKTVIRGE